MKTFTLISMILITVAALIVHADRLPQPPGPAYSGFMPGNWQYRPDEAENPGCD